MLCNLILYHYSTRKRNLKHCYFFQTTSLLEEMMKKKSLREKVQQVQAQKAEGGAGGGGRPDTGSIHQDAYNNRDSQGGREGGGRGPPGGSEVGLAYRSYSTEMQALHKTHRGPPGGTSAGPHQTTPQNKTSSSSSANPSNGLEQQVLQEKY